MDVKFCTFITILSVISADGRLIHKNKTKTSEAVQADNPNPTIRLTRQIDDEALIGLDKDDIVTDEFLQSYNKRHKKFSESNPKYVRTVRNLSRNITKRQKVYGHKKESEISSIEKSLAKFNDADYYSDFQWKPNKASLYKIHNEHATVLVKKPIPKFSDIDYYDDFQTKMNKARAVLADSGDHEDEDFNLDDYDFDVNHDEFLSGRKPLEPRLNLKALENIVLAKPEFKVITKIVNPIDHRAVKREDHRERVTEASDYFDTTPTNININKGSQESDNDYSDESDDSKEGRKTPVRSIRSWDVSTYFKKFGDNTSKLMTKFLTVLPMFPQVPNDKNLNTPY